MKNITLFENFFNEFEEEFEYVSTLKLHPTHQNKVIKTMGLIKEPKNVDFTVLDKPCTDKERR